MAIRMYCVYIIFVAIFSITINGTYISSSKEAQSGPKWPTEYYLRGEIVDIFNAGSEPFELWYSAKLNRSRMDLYDGAVKKYYWADRKKLVTIHPKSIDLKTIITKCDYETSKKKPYNILPAGVNWTLTGTGTYNGVDTQTWEAREAKYHQTVTTRKNGDIDIPISLEEITYEVGTKATVAHTNTIFFDYNSTVENETLDIEKEKFDEECGLPYATVEKGLQHLRHYIPHDVEVAFTRYKSHHKKTYNDDKHKMREEIFRNKWRHVTSHNRKNLSYKLDLNQFADWTDDELMSLRGALPPMKNDPGTHPFPRTLEEVGRLVDELPEGYDLRMEGVLPSIKNQQDCGSCWAFATTATVETAIIKDLGGVQLDLSEQSLVDCAWSYGVYGCNGGFVSNAFKYVKDNGIPTEAEYGGYWHEDGFCHISNMSVTHRIKGYTQVTPHSVNALKFAVYTHGAVEVTIHASDDMVLYSSGLFYDMSCKGQYLNHAVVVVGYGTLNEEPYWIVRNSWGETWGLDGYIMMSAKDNNCLILDAPYYPII